MVRSRVATNGSHSGMPENGHAESTRCASTESFKRVCVCEPSQPTNYISLTAERFISTFHLAHTYWVRIPIYARIAVLLCLLPFFILPAIGFLFVFPFLLIAACFCYCIFFSPATFNRHIEEVYCKYAPSVKKSFKVDMICLICW